MRKSVDCAVDLLEKEMKKYSRENSLVDDVAKIASQPEVKKNIDMKEGSNEMSVKKSKKKKKKGDRDKDSDESKKDIMSDVGSIVGPPLSAAGISKLFSMAGYDPIKVDPERCKIGLGPDPADNTMSPAKKKKANKDKKDKKSGKKQKAKKSKARLDSPTEDYLLPSLGLQEDLSR